MIKLTSLQDLHYWQNTAKTNTVKWFVDGDEIPSTFLPDYRWKGVQIQVVDDTSSIIQSGPNLFVENKGIPLYNGGTVVCYIKTIDNKTEVSVIRDNFPDIEQVTKYPDKFNSSMLSSCLQIEAFCSLFRFNDPQLKLNYMVRSSLYDEWFQLDRFNGFMFNQKLYKAHPQIIYVERIVVCRYLIHSTQQ